MSDDFDHLSTEYERLKAKALATAQREAVEAFYAAVIRRWKDSLIEALEAEIAKWREGQ